MTLSTNIYVLDPLPPRELFTYCQSLLTQYDDEHRTPEQQQWKETESIYPNSRALCNIPDQGLPAWLWVYYRPDAPLLTEEEAAQHDSDCEPDCSTTQHGQPCALSVNFDTGYSYRDSAGRDCSQLHVLLIAGLGVWLDERRIRWKWKNEFSGKVYDGYDDLPTLISSGEKAVSWFNESVLPAILSGRIS